MQKMRHFLTLLLRKLRPVARRVIGFADNAERDMCDAHLFGMEAQVGDQRWIEAFETDGATIGAQCVSYGGQQAQIAIESAFEFDDQRRLSCNRSQKIR